MFAVLAVAGTIASVLLANRKAAEVSTPKNSAAATQNSVQRAVVTPVVKADSAPALVAVESPAAKSAAPQMDAATDQFPIPVKIKKPKPEAQDPIARVALSLVGADAAADEYWIAAINDTSLPPDERRELIEDLNQDGFMDKKHPGPGDYQLIASRIQLIEELAPSAMDQINADAFAEADRKSVV